jgi:hypothetical protein
LLVSKLLMEPALVMLQLPPPPIRAVLHWSVVTKKLSVLRLLSLVELLLPTPMPYALPVLRARTPPLDLPTA